MQYALDTFLWELEPIRVKDEFVLVSGIPLNSPEVTAVGGNQRDKYL